MDSVAYLTSELGEPERKVNLDHNIQKGNHAGQENDKKWIYAFIKEELQK